jgi:putative methionine-R-sulfoxide reductase with GAF domain
VTAKSDAYRAVVDAVDRMVNRGDDADAVLRAVVDLLHDRLGHCSRASIFLVEEGDLALGPSRGSREAQGSELAVPIAYEGRQVGELRVESAAPEAFDDEDRRSLERIAKLISQHALVAWDTGGRTWDP